jgi:hypothetical protein
MRDTARIGRIFGLLRSHWLRNKDQRFGQLLINLSVVPNNSGIFYCEDEALVAQLRERLKPQAPQSKVWLVWSNEHRAWWAPDRCGYRQRVDEAGRYTCEEAMACCAMRSNTGIPPEVMVPSPEYLESLAGHEVHW